MLAWGVLEFGKAMGPDLPHALEAVRWATDYFLKATAVPGVVYAQVGDPYLDHYCWERPEAMDTPRTTYAVFEFADEYQGSYNDSLRSAVCPFLLFPMATSGMAICLVVVTNMASGYY
ncbi:unnamed protein product [Thlaspi arvense]|uniref:cellulase n=1 Tax=Thlaspi arvense TaxID=13288 RepID=A0AAU9RLX3_THLAR|nr:unnamed protein product [Thlaspi arvense]